MNNFDMDERKNSLANMKWFKMGKQTAEAKKVYWY